MGNTAIVQARNLKALIQLALAWFPTPFLEKLIQIRFRMNIETELKLATLGEVLSFLDSEEGSYNEMRRSQLWG